MIIGVNHLKQIRKMVVKGLGNFNRHYKVFYIRDRRYAAPLFLNFEVGNDVFAIDITCTPNNMVEISLFKRVVNTPIGEAGHSHLLKKSDWNTTLQKPEYKGWGIKAFDSVYYRIYRDYPATSYAQIAADIATVVNGFTFP